ncbi:NUDIX hydrolase [Isachenkonia alkalipeptolytica]|uniref:NUDIX hydrolase n=1 Tax=Isachenkonia alkalipeptolytica TaxID=2565777 RepID=A0AA43XLZ3_9CLOT|nr:NUDIX hydrolase [Isachenkonia alkalipeptolytica]NBG88774.1 NUDIX hydrolase [Isachenkonia alkalipeptolytica]
MKRQEETLKSERIYEGKVINLRVDTVELPDKKYSKREIVEHSGAVGIIGINDKGQVVLVKQYRKAVDEFLIEIPAGKMEPKEDPEACAKREFKEETGYEANDFNAVAQFYTSPGFSNEEIYLFEAKSLCKGTAEPDEDEYIEIIEISFETALEKISNGEIKDSKTILAILLAKETR